jgi:hypothetical protein
MKQKIILGIMSEDPYNGKEDFLKQIIHHGFTVHSIYSKIEEMARYLVKSDGSTRTSEITQENIDEIRKKGYAINKLYWVNLLLTSISEKANNIMISDLWYDDLYEGYVIPVVSDPILVPNLKFIRYPDKVEIRRWIKEVEEKMYNTK